MIVNVSDYGSKARGGQGAGRSFKGALTYYLHDKREAGQTQPVTTSERVAWTETRNLNTDDMRTAQRVMIATAKNEQNLKREAGRRVGKKTEFPVYSYSLSWHPTDEPRPTREEMVRAADESLKAIGAEGRQAVVICHTDRDHSHVHIVVNRIDDRDGMALSTGMDFDKFDRWAHKYEVERGYIVTPERAAKFQRRERHPDAAERRKYTEQKRAAAKEQAHDTKSQATMLRELGASQKVKHGDQWRDLAAREKADRNEIYRLSGVAIAATIEQHKAECKPIWAEHYRGKRAAERRFNQREKSMSGVVVNAFVAARHQQATGQLEGRGLFTATVANVFSSRARQQAFEQAQEMTRQQLASRLKSIGDKEVSDLKEQRGRDLAKHRDLYKAERGALIDRQDGERAKLREAWKQLYGDRSEWSRQGGERGTKPYRAGSQRDEQQRAAPYDRKAAYQAYHQKGAGRMAEGKAFPTFEEAKRAGEEIVRAKNDAHRQKEEDNGKKWTAENKGRLQEGISKSKSAAQSAAAEERGEWKAKISAVDAQHSREVRAVEAQHKETVKAVEKAHQPPPDRKAAYLAERAQMQREMPSVLNARDEKGNKAAPDRATAYLSERPATESDPQREMPPVLNRKEAVAQQKQEAERGQENQNGDKGKENTSHNRPAPSRDWPER